jgi:hypothetical protein
MNRKQVIIPLLAITVMAACVKHQNAPATTQDNPQVTEAKTWFEQNVLSRLPSPNSNNHRATLPRTVRWDQASVVTISGVAAVVVPIQFLKDVYLRADNSGAALFRLSEASRLVIYKDSLNTTTYQQLTFIPDSTMHPGDSTFSGIMLSEDWSGNTLSRPSRINSRSTHTTVDIVEQTQVCNTVYGYNYSEDNPDDTYEWSETTCTMYSFVTAPLGGHSGLSSPLPVTRTLSFAYFRIAIVPPTNAIGSIADYIKCFSNYGGSDHTYQVTLCVDQPDPGTTEPWGISSTGVGGSSAGGNPVDVGHTFLVLTENFSGYSIIRNVGFYPSTNVYPWSTTAQGALGNDDGHNYNISLTVNVDNGQFFNILNYISQGNNAGYMYDLNTNNCTTFALQALSAGNVVIPATEGSWMFNGHGYDPGDLGQNINNMTLSSNMTRNNKYSDHPNQYTCN